MPELVDIINFETSSGENIKILEQIGTHYSDFGILLLQDKNGAVVQSIIEEANNKAVKINRDILTKWLEGTGKQPITWATLIGVLKDINLRVLAKKLEDNLTIPGMIPFI